MKTTIDGLANAIAKELSEYSQDVTDGLKKSVKQVSKECKDEIVQNSPVLTGSYKNGWATKVSHEANDDIRITVHNRTDYQLTHLLEIGHAGPNGIGRDTPAKPHIRPAEEHAAEKLMRKVKVVVKG